MGKEQGQGDNLLSSSVRRPPYAVQAIDRALDILETIADSSEGITVTEVADRVKLPLSTAHRLMAHLSYRGYLEHDATTRRYSLGMKVLLLRGKLLQSARLEDQGYPIIRELARLTGETAHLAVLYEGEVVYLRTAEGPNTVLLYTPPGKRAPAYCTSLGKAILAHLPAAEARRIVEKSGMRRLTHHTMTTWEEFGKELSRIQVQGFAVDNEESEVGVRCIGAPVFGHSDTVVGAISVAGPAARLTVERIPDLGRKVVRAATEISQRLGYAHRGAATS